MGLRLCVVGGGTGGHVVPGLHMLSALLEADHLPGLDDLLWFETGRAAEVASMARLEGIISPCVPERVRVRVEPKAGGAPSKTRLLAKTPGAFWAARRALKAHRCDVVFGLGGFTLLPVVLAAKSLGIPVVLLEINAVPGRAVRSLTFMAVSVLHAWPSSLPAGSAPGQERRCVHRVTGPPLGPRFTTPISDEQRRAAGSMWRERIGASPGAPLLVVLGGSQGAGALNDFVGEHLDQLLQSGIGVIHQVGPGRMAEAADDVPGYGAFEFIDDVPELLGAATMALSRAGASTLAELAALGVPSMVVPYPGAGGHQRKNANELEGGLLLVEEPDLGASALERLIALIGPEGTEWRLAARATLMRRVPADAALQVAAELVRFVK